MRAIRLILIISFLALTSCASVFNLGREDFVCKGDGEGGRCGDPVSIYENRNRIMEEARVKEYQKKQEAEGTKSKAATKESTAYLNVKYSEEELEDAPVPVRDAERIQRIRIYSFQDEAGTMFGDIWAFTVVRHGRWYLPDGRVLE